MLLVIAVGVLAVTTLQPCVVNVTAVLEAAVLSELRLCKVVLSRATAATRSQNPFARELHSLCAHSDIKHLETGLEQLCDIMRQGLVQCCKAQHL